MKLVSDAAILAAAQSIADADFDGHMTVMKFTTGWRISFGPQPTSREDIQAMPAGDTLSAALAAAISPKG